jgi:hypothetical protein
MTDTVKNLRDGRRVTIFDRSTKTFIRFRLNPSEKRICWIKEVSLDRRNWVNHNLYFSLHDVMLSIKQNKEKNYV